MYESFFALRRNPFRMTADGDFLFFTAKHREAFAGLTYAIMNRKGFAVLTGDAGTGKTTLLRALAASIPASRVQLGLILNSTLTPSEFFELALMEFGFSDVPASKARRIVLLRNLLLQNNREGKITALIVDEAHKLSAEVLEEIRLLTNFEDSDCLLQIVLAGQPELAELFRQFSMRQIKQRVNVRLSVEALSPAEVDQYVQYRWHKAGGADPLPFGPEVVARLAVASKGIARTVNAICDNALLNAFSRESRIVDKACLEEALQDLDLLAEGGLPPTALADPPASSLRRNAETTRPEPALLQTLERYAPPADASTRTPGWLRWTVRLWPARNPRMVSHE